jgi:hypothetical protein
MSAPNLSPYIVPPDIRALFDGLIDEMFAKFNCHVVGTVQSFNDSKQTVQVSAVYQRAVFNNPPSGNTVQTEPTVLPYPLLFDVPVLVLGGGSASLQFPIAVGDGCLVLFADRDLDPWFTNGTTGALPNSYRMHSIADGIALVGLRSAPQALTGYDSSRARLVNGASQISVGTLVRISNAVTSMLTVQNAIISALNALNAVKSGGDASGAISAAQTQVTDLFET